MRGLAAARSRRRAASVVLVVLATGLLLGACDGSEQQDPGGAGPGESDQAATATPTRKACAENARKLGLRCGAITVPLERADPELGEIEIDFAVRPPTNGDEPEGTIFAVEGGPGYGSIGSARSYINLFGDLLDDRQLVVVDARGTGHSGAIDCPGLQGGTNPDWLAVAACARELGEAAGSYRTAAAADDIDDVREALGVERIALYGDSYGTYLAQSYAFRHPETLEALVVDSAYPVRGESGWYPSLLPTGIAAINTTCERDRSCRGDAAQRLRQFVAELRARGRSLGPLIDAIASAGYSPPGSYREVDRAAAAFLAGDERPYAELTREGKADFGPANYYSRGDELAVSCNDYPMIWNKQASEAERRAQLDDAIAAYPKDAFAPFEPREVALDAEFAGYLECLTWPAPNELYEPPAEADAPAPEIPVMVIAGELDNVTSPTEAKMVADEFPNSKYVEIRNAGHVPSLYGNQYPAARKVREFLRRELG